MKNTFLLSVALLLLMTEAAAAEDDAINRQQHHLLMIGNSYTGQNNLDQLLDAMLEEAYGQGAVESYRYSQGGKVLSAHLDDALSSASTNTNNNLRKWLVTDPLPLSWTVIQEQSQTAGFVDFPDLFQVSLDGAVGLNKLVAENTAGPATGGSGETIFFMTWGRRNGDRQNPFLFPDFLTMNAKLLQGYQRYVDATSTAGRPTKLAPVGLAFEYIYRDLVGQGLDPLVTGSEFHSLYNNDGSHPSLQGSYLAACVLYFTITGKDPRLLAYAPSGLLNDDSVRLRAAAYYAVDPDGKTQTTSTPIANPTLTPTLTPTSVPTLGPTTSFPSPRPTAHPSRRFTNAPSPPPTIAPTETFSQSPTQNPTQWPSVELSEMPTTEPSLVTSASPSTIPSGRPTTKPSLVASTSPSTLPSETPSRVYSSLPSSVPSIGPSDAMSGSPSEMPTWFPSSFLSASPSNERDLGTASPFKAVSSGAVEQSQGLFRSVIALTAAVIFILN